MATTATYRTDAITAESAMCWSEAAYCWEQAIANYPIIGRAGALAKADIARMTVRMNACRATFAEMAA